MTERACSGWPCLTLASDPDELMAAAASCDAIVLARPGNPGGEIIAEHTLQSIAERLAAHRGWLIVDEAFADSVPENSVTAMAGSESAPNLIVLRSLGKFFGLAGARVGFVFGNAEKLGLLRESLGPWTVSHPARVVARHALEDSAWQATMRSQLAAASLRLAELLAPLGEVTRSSLFCTLKAPRVAALFEHFARRAILIRRFDQFALLRFGLPGSEAQWQRLSAAIAEFAG